MVRRYEILKGDRTTAEGSVMGGDSNDRVGDREQAQEWDEVWCPECESIGRIVCDGPRWRKQGRRRQRGRMIASSRGLPTLPVRRASSVRCWLKAYVFGLTMNRLDLDRVCNGADHV